MAADVLGTLILLPPSDWWLHKGDLERRRFPAPFGGASSTFRFSFFRLCCFPWTCHLNDVGFSETYTSQRQQWG